MVHIPDWRMTSDLQEAYTRQTEQLNSVVDGLVVVSVHSLSSIHKYSKHN